MTLNSRNQSKWDSLQDAGQTHIDRVLAGRGTKEDIDAISKLLADQHELAGQIFEQGVEDAVRTANQVVNNLERQRVESGKRSLTDRAQERLFNRAFQDVMSQAIDDILGQVHDEFEAQDQAIRDRVESALERIRALPAPQQQAPQDGPRRPADRLLGTQVTHEEVPDEPQSRSLMDRVLTRQEQADAQRTEVMQMIRDTAGSIRDRVTSLYERFSRSNEDSDEEKRAAIWMRRLKAMFSPFGRAWSKTKAGASKAQDLLEMIGKPLMLAVMNPQLIQTITDEVSKILNFDNISKFVDSTWEETKKIGTDSLDWIIDKVKSLLGFGSKKEKPATRTDTVAKAAQASQKVTELPKEISPAEAKAKLPVQQSGLTQAQKQLEVATARYKASPTAANKKAVDEAQMSVNYWQSRVTMYGARAQQATKLAGADLDQASRMVSPTTAVAPNTTAANEVSAGQASSAVQQATEVSSVPASTTTANPAQILSRSNAAVPATQVIGDMPRYVPGKAYDSPEKQQEEKAAAEKGKAAIAQIGLGSFGFDSVDPALNILNLGMIS